MILFVSDQTEILSKLSPIIYTAVVVVIVYSFLHSIAQGKFKKMILQIIVCAVVAYMVINPDSLLSLGEFIVNTTTSLGGDIFGY